MTVVLTMGSFDGLHPGHIGLLKKCHLLADEGQVVVALNTDKFIEKFKHVETLYNYAERKLMLEGSQYVSRVVENDGTRQEYIITDLRTAFRDELMILVIGDDWAQRDYLAQIGLGHKRGMLEERGIVLVYVPRTGTWSSTELRARLGGDS